MSLPQLTSLARLIVNFMAGLMEMEIIQGYSLWEITAFLFFMACVFALFQLVTVRGAGGLSK